MDPADYAIDEDEESSDDEEDEHLAPSDSALPVPDSVPSTEETKPFETDESTATPPSPHTIVPLSQTGLRRARRRPNPSHLYQHPLRHSLLTMVQLRAASPSTYHPLLPLEIPSPPIPLPLPDRRGAIPEADMSPRKRTCFTAPSHRFEIRESSAAAATRQTGSALACGVDYGLIDNLDSSIQATDKRVMTALEEVNVRMTDLAATHRYADKACYARQAWAHSEDRSQAIKAQIRALHDEVRVLQRHRIDDEKMAPKKAPVSDATIKALIDQGIANALAEYEANRGSGNGHDNHGSGSVSGRTTNYHECWGLPDMIQGSVMASKPKTMQDAIKFAYDVMDQKIRTFAKRQARNKRKLDDSTRKNQTQQQPFKRQNVARAYTVGPGEKREYGGSLPLCAKCNYHHTNPCVAKCTNCKRVGHLARDCRSPAATNNQRAPEAI
ncbi:reverse transcriptase domain-containing protein [Tanacetum coccineum]|uniref:Reverse transcriptase domain-containing protein n=1 Tax=Tanacetum coccineum TaxID=301880 RepID=A0ABQ4XC77_9ASTR